VILLSNCLMIFKITIKYVFGTALQYISGV
jgi:hypothetical protein